MAELDIKVVEDVAIQVVKGDDKDYEFAVKTAGDVAVNVASGYTARLQGRVGGRTGRQAIVLDSGSGNGLTMGNGKITMSLLAAQTALLNVGTSSTADSVIVPFELEIVKTGTPNQVKTIATGSFTVREKLVGKVPVTSVSLDESTLSLKVGGTDGSLTATVLPAFATDPTVVWASSDTNIATVSGGTVTPVAEGTCTITATADGVVASCVVTVAFVNVSSVTLDKETLSLTAEGATDTLVATVLPVDASAPTVTWTSSDPLVASVSSSGVVTPLTVGVVTITATADGKSATCAVTVTE